MKGHNYSIYFSDIRIGFDSSDGAWSYIGTDYIDRGTILHKFGHTLGLIHEHQSPASGGFQWNREEVIKCLSGPLKIGTWLPLSTQHVWKVRQLTASDD